MVRQLFNTLLPLLLFLGFYVCVRAFFSSIKRSPLHQQPRQNGVALEFFPVARMQFLVRVALVLLAAFAILVAVATHKESNSVYALLIPLFVLVMIYLAQPVTVIVDQNGICQPRWFRGNREIAWSDIASVARGPNTGTTYVRSKHGGPKIRFSPFLVGRAHFENEVRVHVRNIDIPEDD